MEKENKEIAKIVQNNYEVPDDVNQKINNAFEEIKKQNPYLESKNKKEEFKMEKTNIVYKVAIVLIFLFLTGNAVSLAFGGNNIYTMIYKFFVPTSNEVVVEGEKEEVNNIGVQSSLGYKIEYDKEDFKLERIGDKDYYRVNIPDMSESVYFVIYHTDSSYENLDKKDKTEETKIDGKNAFMVELIDGKKQDSSKNYSLDSKVVDTWHIDAGKGSYIIEAHYTIETVEGWGSRIRQMINSFKIVES